MTKIKSIEFKRKDRYGMIRYVARGIKSRFLLEMKDDKDVKLNCFHLFINDAFEQYVEMSEAIEICNKINALDFENLENEINCWRI